VALDLLGLPADIIAGDIGLALSRVEDAAEHAHGGRLACAIGADQAEDLAGVRVEVNAVNCRQTAKALAEAAGADGITAINTLGPGLILDIESGWPVLANRLGGVSGPAIRPIAVKCVRDVCKAVKIPVVATGGVTDARDAVEMVLVGATAVGVGTAVNYRGMSVFNEIAQGMAEYMRRHGYARLEDFRGKALQYC